MPKLTPEERKRLLQLIETDSPLGREWQEKLFAPSRDGELFWEGKTEARNRVAAFLPGLSPAQPDVGQPANVTEPREVDTLNAGCPLPPTLSANWSGLLFEGDNFTVGQYLLQKGHCLGLSPSPFSLIYIDPPFFTETDFHARVPRNSRDNSFGNPRDNPLAGSPPKLDSSILKAELAENAEQDIFAYSDRWRGGRAEYFTMLYERIMLMHALLAPTGILCVHCDWRAAPGVRFILDECFGQGAFVNEIIWHYTGGGRSKRYLSRKHDSILVYAKGKEWTFNIDAIRVPYKKTSGFAKSGIVSKGGKRYLPNPLGTPLDDVWDIPMVNPMAKERVTYATQKPLMLLERIIQAFSNEGDLIGDFFCGSGTTLLAGLGLKRRVVGCDFGSQAIEVTRERLRVNGFSPAELSMLPVPCTAFAASAATPQPPSSR